MDKKNYRKAASGIIIDKGDITLDYDEIRTYKWVTLDELESHLVFPNQYVNVKRVLEEIVPDLK